MHRARGRALGGLRGQVVGSHERRRFEVFSTSYTAGHLLRNRKAGLGWISYLRTGAFYTTFSIAAPEFFVFAVNVRPGFLSTRYLSRGLTLYSFFVAAAGLGFSARGSK